MIATGCNNISVVYGTDTIIENITFHINAGDKLGIVGVNGAGKSTLLNVINGLIEPTSGDVFIGKNLTVEFFEQNMLCDFQGSVIDAAYDSFRDLICLEEQLNSLKQKAIDNPDLADSYTSAEISFTEKGGYMFRGLSRGILKHVGFNEEMFNMDVSSLSGGQRTRLALACKLLKSPDILILDEPTNHLDSDTLDWLETYISSHAKTVICVSHDRYFLDKITTHILEIENTHCKLYTGNYTQYVVQKKNDADIYQKHYENQQKEIARIEAYIEQQRCWNRERNIIAAESRMKMLNKMDKLSAPEKTPQKVKLTLSASGDTGNEVIKVKHLSKNYPNHPLFSDVNLILQKKERIFVFGNNGCGKSTFLRMICGNLPPDTGSIELGHRVQIGYYDQENQNLHNEKTVLDELWDEFYNSDIKTIRSVLARFNFNAEDIEKKISVLSGGEKARLTMAKLVMSNHNLLVLDEPTNHLDIQTREALEETLLNYDGTLLIVSHDRYFINKLATKILYFEDNTIKYWDDDYKSFCDYFNKKTTDVSNNVTVLNEESENKKNFMDSKKEKAARQKLQRDIQKARDSQAKIESEIEEIDIQINNTDLTDYQTIADLCDKKTVLEEKLMELYEFLETNK